MIVPIETQEDLMRLLKDEWGWYNQYGEELFTLFISLNVPLLVPIPQKARAKKPTLSSQPKSISKHIQGGGSGRRKTRQAALDRVTSGHAD